jgi:MFS family permease
MADHLMSQFHINATQFGIFAAYYYYSYTAMQIPVGVILDHFSIRKSLLAACIVCIIGLFLVHMVTNVYIASMGRFIMGFGCAFAFVAVLKVATVWLAPRHFGMVACIADSLGMLAGIFADLIITKLNVSFGYQSTMWTVALIGVIVAALILFVLRDSPKTRELDQQVTREAKSFSHIFRELANMIKNPQIWIIGVLGALAYLPSSALGDVWGIPYLSTVYHMSTIEAGRIMSTFFFGWMIVGPFVGELSDHFRNRKMPIVISLFLDAVLLTLILYVPYKLDYHVAHWILYVAFFLFGALTSTHPLIFALAKENYDKSVAGTVVALTNCLVMLGGVVFQPLTGYMIDTVHRHFTLGTKAYTPLDFTLGIALVPVSLLVAAIIAMWLKDTGKTLV